MIISQLKAQNFRCFEQETFDFLPGFNLFVGVNGSGKTSLLKAVAASLAAAINGFGRRTFQPFAKQENIRLALIEVQGRVRYEYCYPVRLDVTGELNGETRDWWLLQAAPEEHQIRYEHTVVQKFTNMAASISQGSTETLPIVVFYSAERQWKQTAISAETAVKQQDSRLDGYASWENASLDMKGLETWFITKSLEKLELISSTGHVVQDIPPDELDLVNQAVAEAVPDSKGLRYDIKYRRLVLDWKKAEPMPFDTLSDGQRGMVALVADIARRMCLLNPQLAGNVLRETSGIVIIDELDIHLHPAWQRRLPNLLKKIFPRVQFIAASHSPQIIGELSASEVWLMHDSKVIGHPERALGLSSSEVLEELMGGKARNEDITFKLESIRTLLDNDQITQAQKELETLHQEVGMIPSVSELQAAIQSLNWLKDGEA